MIKFCVLGSGSLGNATYIEIDSHGYLVDCGFTKPELVKRLSYINRSLDDIEGVFVTHEHTDHIKPWVIKEGLVVINGLEADKLVKSFPLVALDSMSLVVSGLEVYNRVKSFTLSHDAPCVGYTFTDNDGHKLALITDTGCVPEEAIANLFDCSAILIETNYDIDLIIDSPYPIDRLERITSSEGHLRSECAAEVVEMVAGPELEYVVGIHLSGANNHPDLARFCLESVTDSNVEVVISGQKEPTKMMVVI